MKRKDFLLNSSALLATSLVPSTFAAQRDFDMAQASEVKIRRLSWAGLQIEFDGATLFIDPWISKELWDGKWTEPIIEPKSNTSANHIAITHIHNDHFDVNAIKSITGEKRGNIYCGLKTAYGVSSYGINEVKPVEIWEPMLLSAGKITLIAVPAVDFSGIEQVSWVIKAGGKTFFHGGDTIWHGSFHKISSAFGPFDAVFLPINGVDVLQLKPNSHIPATLTPQHAAAVAHVLRAKLVVPIHYGITNPGVYEEFPEVEKTFITECKKRDLNVEICASGDWLAEKANR